MTRIAQLNRMRDLIAVMQKESTAYYINDAPIVTDFEYDAQFDELTALEQATGVILGGSPTQTVSGSVVPFLTAVKHTTPMLSAKKTKDVNVIIAFAQAADRQTNKDIKLSWKLDGLTLVLRYKNGRFKQMLTRGSEGIIGEDVTHNVCAFANIPLEIPCQDDIEIRGEGVVSWVSFDEINNSVTEPYSHPRALAAGSTRQLDPAEASKRGLVFKAFDCILPKHPTKQNAYDFMTDNGFDIVDYVTCTSETIADKIAKFDPIAYTYPVDGIIAEYDDMEFGESLGATGHHEHNKIALKWEDECFKTHFRGTRLQVTKMGLVSLTALFDAVMIGGAKVQKATLHNVSIFEKLCLGIGDEIEVYKANKIIPAIACNNTQSRTYALPNTCPCCGSRLTRITPKETTFLTCPNEACPARAVRLFEHFASKSAMDIKGLGTQALTAFLSSGFIKNFSDIYHLDKFRDEIIAMDGFGVNSYDKIIKAVEKSKDTTLANLIPAFSIPMVGRTAGKIINAYFHGDITAFHQAMDDAALDKFDFHILNDFGDVMCNNLKTFWANENQKQEWHRVCDELRFEAPVQQSTASGALSGKIIVITGTLSCARDEITKRLESVGAKISGSVSKKTDILLAGGNAGSKLDKAISLGVQIMTEAEIQTELEK